MCPQCRYIHIDDRDRKAIKDLIRYQDTQRGLVDSTNVNNCSDLRLSAERADTPLVDMDREDVDALLLEYKHSQPDRPTHRLSEGDCWI